MPMALETRVEQANVPITIVSAKGTLDEQTARDFEKYVKDLVTKGARYLLLDLRGVSFMSSAGIRALNSIFRVLDATVGMNNEMAKKLLSGQYKSPHLKLLGPTPRVAEVLNLVGMNLFLDIYDDEAVARASFIKVE